MNLDEIQDNWPDDFMSNVPRKDKAFYEQAAREHPELPVRIEDEATDSDMNIMRDYVAIYRAGDPGPDYGPFWDRAKQLKEAANAKSI